MLAVASVRRSTMDSVQTVIRVRITVDTGHAQGAIVDTLKTTPHALLVNNASIAVVIVNTVNRAISHTRRVRIGVEILRKDDHIVSLAVIAKVKVTAQT